MNDQANKIVQAINSGGGQTCDIAGVLTALHQAGFTIVRREDVDVAAQLGMQVALRVAREVLK